MTDTTQTDAIRLAEQLEFHGREGSYQRAAAAELRRLVELTERGDKEDALDAARYRWLRQGNALKISCNGVHIFTGPNNERDYGVSLDAAVDAALAVQSKGAQS